MSNGKQAKGQNEARDFRRFIEESFPVKEVGEASAYEKNIRQGHISTLHIWWARRPLAASRATAYAALTPAPKDAEEWQKKRDFIVQLSQWENSNNQSLLERARREILEANGGVPPKVLDPFSGGGSYPLEALRLGCESYANDYNPVAVLVEKATMEYPQKFGRPFEGMPDWAKPDLTPSPSPEKRGEKGKGKKKQEEQPALFDPTIGSESTDFNPLLNAVRYWGKHVLEEAYKELEEFYPSDPDGSLPVGYIWARTIPCQNPSCGKEIPLMRGFWLAKGTRNIALYPEVVKGDLKFRVVGDDYDKMPKDFNPENGTVNRAVATCLHCGAVVDGETTRKLFQDKKSGQRLIAVALIKRKTKGKIYRIATNKDIDIFHKAEQVLKQKREKLMPEWGMDPIPDEPMNTKDPNTVAGRGYGYTRWEELFNSRQKLSLITFIEKVRQIAVHQIDNQNPEFFKAVATYLAFGIDRLADFGSTLCLWNYTGGRGVKGTFARQALPMVWDYAEANPFNPEAAGWETAIEKNNDWIAHASLTSNKPVISTQSSAVSLPYEENYFDAILTDPPYYDNINYAELSDFFYVWLKRSIGFLYPELFSTPLVPKQGEIVANAIRQGGQEKATQFFDEMLKKAFQETYRVLKPNGIAVIVYAHKSTKGWEVLVDSLLDSNLVVTEAWPLDTEREGRVNSQETAALASSIYIVARKMPRNPTGFYNDVRNELQQHLDAKLHRLWEEGIGGGDFFIAAIGSAIEVFGKYAQVMDYEGNIVRADRLLEDVRSIATNYAVKQILHNGFAAEITPMARFYVLWRWNYGEALVPFDEANKLAHSCGLDLSLQFSKNGFIKKEKEFVRMLGPQGRKLDDLDDPRDMIDVMHKALLLWEKGQRSEMVKALSDRGFGKSEAFYRVAQAISETLPLESKEKKLLDGFLAGRDRVQEEVEKSESQGRLL
ncbi:MAG: DUF1156 domain-containing protein [Anaerolineales bacterium]|nr:DUF1156 domain-containing protein [Anaerolineales bacterium]